jgi:hypothetical protein
MEYEAEMMRSKVDIKTIDESWRASPLSTEINFDRGFLELRLGDTRLTGFENDSIWRSSDPFHLVGMVGIHGYNAGLERRGVALDMPLFLKTRLRAMYADKIGERPVPRGVVPAAAWAPFTTTTSPDTTVYRYADVFEDEDSWAIEFDMDLGSIKMGYVKRQNKGLHPGLLIDVVRNGAIYDVGIYETREYWDADVFWLGWEAFDGVGFTGGYGSGDAQVRRLARSDATVSGPADISSGNETTVADMEEPFQSSTRWYGALDYAVRKLSCSVGYEWNEFEFESDMPELTTANVGIASGDLSYDGDRWRSEGRIRYYDQRYKETPSDFHIFTPSRNFWIDYLDRLTVPNLVALDQNRAVTLDLEFASNAREPFARDAVGVDERPSLRILLEAAAFGIFKNVEYASAVFHAENTVVGGFYAQGDARGAWYNKSSWGLDDWFLSAYVEVGYRTSWMEVSIGLGADPVVLDPVTNEYAAIGRVERIRHFVGSSVGRQDSQALGEAVRAGEESLEDDHGLKLEVILFF